MRKGGGGRGVIEGIGRGIEKGIEKKRGWGGVGGGGISKGECLQYFESSSATAARMGMGIWDDGDLESMVSVCPSI